MVLLKNEGGLLPLAGDAARRIALIGAFASEPRYQGAGSSQVDAGRAGGDHPRRVAGRRLGAPGLRGYAPGYQADGTTTPALLGEAQRWRAGAGVAVVVVGLPGSYEEEGADRTHINLPPGHNDLVEAVLAVQPRTVVVLINGSAVALPWVERVPALLEGWLGGQAGGGAIADVLLGKVNPSRQAGGDLPGAAGRHPRLPELPRRRQRAACPSARACSPAIAGTTPAGSRRCSPSATASPTPRSSTATWPWTGPPWARARRWPSRCRCATAARGPGARWCSFICTSRRLACRARNRN